MSYCCVSATARRAVLLPAISPTRFFFFICLSAYYYLFFIHLLRDRIIDAEYNSSIRWLPVYVPR